MAFASYDTAIFTEGLPTDSYPLVVLFSTLNEPPPRFDPQVMLQFRFHGVVEAANLLVTPDPCPL
jgi:hypothetical protein